LEDLESSLCALGILVGVLNVAYKEWMRGACWVASCVHYCEGQGSTKAAIVIVSMKNIIRSACRSTCSADEGEQKEEGSMGDVGEC